MEIVVLLTRQWNADWGLYCLFTHWDLIRLSHLLSKDLRDGREPHDNFYYFIIISVISIWQFNSKHCKYFGNNLAAQNCTDCNTDWTIKFNLGCNIFGITITGVTRHQGTPGTSDIVKMLLGKSYTYAMAQMGTWGWLYSKHSRFQSLNVFENHT